MPLSISTTDVDLCTRALALLGLKGISSLSDGTDKADTCATLYRQVKLRVLTAHPWKFTLTFRQLARETAAPAMRWTYAYALPSDRLGAGHLRLYPTSDVGEHPVAEYEILGGKVYTDEAALWASYQQDQSEDNFPAHVQVLMGYALAAELAEPLTDDTSKAEKWDKEAWGNPGEQEDGGYFRTAKRIDSTGQPGARLSRFPLVDVRG